MKKILGIGVLTLAITQLFAQMYTEKITKDFSFEKQGPENTLIVANVNGSIKVEGYAGDRILIEVNKTINGKTQARLEKGKSDIQLGVIDLADTLILYVDGLCGGFGRNNRKSKSRGHWDKTWSYNWNHDCKDFSEGYSYKMDYVIKVPFALNVDVRTVNDGNIAVDHVHGIVNANNINGSIELHDLMRGAVASTINGDVDIDYSRNPQQDCRFYSLNGDINAWFEKGLAARMSFESFNGDFFTNIDALEALPVQVEKTKAGDGVKYKVNGNRYKIGSGGALLDFETFNGNVYLKEKTK